MIEKVGSSPSDKVCQWVVNGMKAKKAENIVVLDLRNAKNAVSDFFVICSGNSDPHVDAITESIEEEVYKADRQIPWHKEGLNNKSWVLLDYVDVVAHVFKKEQREFYALEKLWGDALLQEIVSS